MFRQVCSIFSASTPSSPPPTPPAAAPEDELDDYVEVKVERPRAFEHGAMLVAADEVPEAAFCEPSSPSRRLGPWCLGRSPRAQDRHRILQAMVADTLTAEPGSLTRAWDEIISRCACEPGTLEGLIDEVPPGDCHTHLLERLLADGQAEILARLLPFLSCRPYGALHRLQRRSSHYIGGARRREGSWVQHGQGLWCRPAGDWILGNWQDGRPEGTLRCFEDPEVYTGELNGLLQRHGRGEVVYPSGQRLRGVWRNDAPSGPALITWPAPGTPSYFGEVVLQGALLPAGGAASHNALPHGEGTLAWAPPGPRLQGTFRGGVIQHGRYTFAARSMLAGFVYQGPVREHRPHGAGLLLRAGSPAAPCRFDNGVLQARGVLGQRLLADPVTFAPGAGASPGSLRHLLARDPEIRYRPAHEGPRPPSPRPPARAC